MTRGNSQKTVPVPNALLILIVASIGVALLHFRYIDNQELRYEGRSIDYWFSQLPVTMVSSQRIIKVESMTVNGKQYGSKGGASKPFAAFNHFGTNAINYLMGKLVEKDSPIERKATKVALKLGVRSLPFRHSRMERGQALTGLLYLKELPPETKQTLTNLSGSSRPEVAEAAKYILRRGQKNLAREVKHIEMHGIPLP